MASARVVSRDDRNSRRRRVTRRDEAKGPFTRARREESALGGVERFAREGGGKGGAPIGCARSRVFWSGRRRDSFFTVDVSARAEGGVWFDDDATRRFFFKSSRGYRRRGWRGGAARRRRARVRARGRGGDGSKRKSPRERRRAMSRRFVTRDEKRRRRGVREPTRVFFARRDLSHVPSSPRDASLLRVLSFARPA